jgi:AcrR family transcriptional regulator
MPSPSPGQTQPRRPRADAERNRARLLDAARAAFASGREPVTLERIARDSGVGIGTLYRHFPTREALVEALYRKELADLCASVEDLLATRSPDRALRAWMDRFADYVAAKREMADALRAVFASGTVTVSHAREELASAVSAVLEADAETKTLRHDVRPEDIVAMIVGSFTATSLAGGREQLERMFDLLMDAVRRQQAPPPADDFPGMASSEN